jgi:hypothetical protein
MLRGLLTTTTPSRIGVLGWETILRHFAAASTTPKAHLDSNVTCWHQPDFGMSLVAKTMSLVDLRVSDSSSLENSHPSCYDLLDCGELYSRFNP